MESSATPDTSPAGEVLQLIDQSIAFTPQPQASSTVNRKTKDSLPRVPLALSNVKKETQASSSPHYLLNAIDGVRFLSNQLGSLSELSGDKMDRQSLSSTQNLRKAASLAHLYHDDRRASTVADSEANSSLGILKLDDCPGLEFSEAEDNGNISDLLQKFRKDSLLQSLPEKENCKPNPVSTNSLFSELPTSTVDSTNRRRQVGSDISATILNSDRLSSQSKIMEADLRLRLQKALAQRTMDRSLDSARLSQLSDSYDVDRFSIGNSMELVQADSTKDAGSSTSITSQTITPANNTTFGAANFISFSGSPATIDSLSSENFQPADMAMDRLKKDENSWHRQFGDLPVFEDGDAVKSNPSEVGNLTQNLDLSNMSGIMAGDVTVNSSMMGGVGMRRLSAGEYFKLRTEQLGGMSEDERPNFGHSIQSPPKRRPHPPLINMSPQDDVPTRDSGFNKTLNYSIPDTLNFSASAVSEPAQSPSTRNSDVQDVGLASRSIDLMPPPPNPKPHFKNIVSDTRDSLSARLSVSLSLPRESHDGTFKDLNSSALSLDSGEKFVSISQMVKIMQDLPSGTKSARQLVDDFMQRCTVSEPKTQSSGLDQRVQDQNFQFAKDSSVAKTSVTVSSENSPSRNERVKQWISTINDSVFEREFGDTTHTTYSCGDDLPGNWKSSKGTEKGKQGKCSVKQERYSDHANEKMKGSYHVYEDHESISSFMPPPTKTANPNIQFQNFSTPKAHEKQTVHKFSHQVADVKPLNGHIKNKLELKNHDQLHGRLSMASRSSQGSDQQRGQFYGSRDQTDSKHSSHSSSSTLKSFRQGTSSQKSDYGSKMQQSDLKHTSPVAAPRPPSNCGSTRSISTTKSTSKQTDAASVTGGPLQIDSTHTQLSWASVSPGSSVTQTFALRNKALARVRLLVSSPSAAFKLVGERGEMLPELVLTLHSEETRRIHVVFSPLSLGPVVGKLVISRVITSESSSAMPEDRRLIALYGYGGKAELAVDGASKDRWAQLFLNMCTIECDTRSAVSDIDGSHDAPQVVASFSIRNSGKVSAFVSLQIAEELPFDDCGVYVTPKALSLTPGEVKRVSVRFDPGRDILQWLNKNADDMQLLANIWLSWSELATWQRIRRIYTKYYKSEKTGSLSTWGCLYTGDLGVGHELKDNKSSEAALAQAVRRLKVAVLIERERLNLFDMDATMVFDQLIANETAMFNSPQLNDKTIDSSEFFDSPIIAGAGMKANDIFGSPTSRASSIKAASPLSSVPSQNHQTLKLKQCLPNELNVVTACTSSEHQSFTLEFPPTTLGHKSKVKITFQNPSSQKNLVSVSDLSAPFSVSTPKLQVPPVSYATMSLFFRPLKAGIHHCTFNIVVDGNHVRSYLLRGEGIHL